MTQTAQPPANASCQDILDQWQSEEDVLREGGGKAGQARQAKLGRLNARQRLQMLCDPGSDYLELGLWAGWKMYPDAGEVPAAGVLTAIGPVEGRPCMIIANDATVKAGAFFPQTGKKVLRAQRIAFENNLPLIYLVGSAGVYLPMQDEIFPDEDDFGRIFRNNAVYSAGGLPQIAAIMGNCVAGGAYLPVLSDKILMTEGSGLYLAGPALVKAAIGQVVEPEDLGGAAMHAQISGTVDFHEPDDPHCLRRLRSLVATIPHQLPSPDASAWPADDPGPAPAQSPEKILDLITPDSRKPYDVRDLLACLVDANSIDEYKKDFGGTLVCAYARLGGRPLGIVANQRKPVTSATEGIQMPGVIYHDSADKAARFVLDCNQNQLPLLFLQDVQGFMVGKQSEQAGIIRAGAKLVNAVSNSTVPKITLIIGGSYGAGNYALCGKAFDPRFIFAWPHAKYAVMGPAQAANTLLSVFKHKAERSGKPLTDAQLSDIHTKIRADYESQANIRYGAARGWVDALISPLSTRQTLLRAFALTSRPQPHPQFTTGVFQV